MSNIFNLSPLLEEYFIQIADIKYKLNLSIQSIVLIENWNNEVGSEKLNDVSKLTEEEIKSCLKILIANDDSEELLLKLEGFNKRQKNTLLEQTYILWCNKALPIVEMQKKKI